MATKKQKRLAGEARAKIHAEQSRQIGLQAQKRDRERRERKAKETLEIQNRKIRKHQAAAAMRNLGERMFQP